MRADYIINVGTSITDAEPHESATTEAYAIKRARELLDIFNYTEVVFMPEDDFGTEITIWSSTKNN